MTNPHSDDRCLICGQSSEVEGPVMHPITGVPNLYVCENCINDPPCDRTVKPLSEDIADVWSDYDDFKTGGFNYVGWLVKRDIEEMRNEKWAEYDCTREFADVSINAIRALDELSSFDPESAIRMRLKQRMDGNQETIISRCQRDYEVRL